jgi:hypothetical protein
MIQESEIINLILGIIAVLIILLIFRKLNLPSLRFFYAGFAFLLCAYVFTVVEGFIWCDFFNVLEHLSLALSGITFALACWLMSKQSMFKEWR